MKKTLEMSGVVLFSESLEKQHQVVLAQFWFENFDV